MNAMLAKELPKLSIEERRALIDNVWDSSESELETVLLSEEAGRLLDDRAAALARVPGRKKFTRHEIAARRNVKLRHLRSSMQKTRSMTSMPRSNGLLLVYRPQQSIFSERSIVWRLT